MLFFLLSLLQSQIVSDVIYFVCVNALGLYFRFMNEVVIRRSFLDRRKCVESTLRLNYEKDQEVGLNGLNYCDRLKMFVKLNMRHCAISR